MASTGPTAEVDIVPSEDAQPTEDPFATVAGRALPSNADGTLGAQDSLEPSRSSPILLVAMLGVALFFALLGFGAIATVGAVYIGTTQVASTTPAVAPDPVKPVVPVDVRPAETKPEVPAVKPVDVPKKVDAVKEAKVEAKIEAKALRPDVKPEVKPEVKTDVPAVVPVAKTVATVKILTQPPTATVIIDGAEARGRSPVKLELAPGTHQVEVKSGDQSGRFSITVTADGENRWCWSFADNRAASGSCKAP